MIWEKKAIPPEELKEFAAKYGCDLLTASILFRRGIAGRGGTSGGTGSAAGSSGALCAEKNLLYYFENDKRYLHNPYLLPNMEDAVERILAAKEEKEAEKILVFGDRDVDGITGAALLTSWLRAAGFDADWRVPKADEPYGLSVAAVEEAARNAVTLIITVDCGISCFEEIDRANELGIDVIITDHHIPRETTPDALAIVNPKLESSRYPFREISGCAVAYKLVSALRYAHKSKSYGQPLCLLNVRPSNDAYCVEAVKTRNLAITASLCETVVPGAVHIGDTRLPAFLSGQQILVWDAEAQKKMLAAAFGTGIDFNLFDAAPEIIKEIPGVAGKSLLRLREVSVLARYADRPVSELDVFFNLFVSYMQKRDGLAGADDDELLQLAALGTIADIMPLDNENRVIVRAGLQSLNARARPGVSNLLAKLDLAGRMLTAHEISWKLTPAINSTGRMGRPDKAVALLLSEDRAERETLAGEVVRMNEERKAVGETVWATALPQAEESLPRFNGKFAVVTGEDIPRGVTGIIANRLVGRLGVPALIVSLTAETAVGSLRSTRGFALTSLLESCADLFIDHGGHDFAAGFSMNRSNMPALLDRLASLSAAVEFDTAPRDDVLMIDGELPPDYLSPDIFKLIDLFEPYGKDNPPLVFLARGLIVRDIAFIGAEANHVRCVLDAGRHKWPCIYWQAAQKAGADFSEGDQVGAVFNITRDYYGGKEKPQLVLLDMQREGA